MRMSGSDGPASPEWLGITSNDDLLALFFPVTAEVAAPALAPAPAPAPTAAAAVVLLLR